MSGVDTAWLRMDSQANLMMIVGVWVFDAPLRREALAERLRDRLLVYDRFRQFVHTDPTGAWWVTDESFDLDSHLVCEQLADPDSEAELQRLAGRLASEPLASNRPLWQFHLIEDYRGASALVTRIHHCIADGIALVKVMLSMSDDGHAATPRRRRSAVPSDNGHEDLAHTLMAMIEPMRRSAMKSVEKAGDSLSRALEATGESGMLAGLLSIGGRVTQDALAIALMTEDSRTRLKGKPGRHKVVAWNDPLPLEDVKTVCRALGVSVNDVLLSCVAGALRRYLDGKGDDTRGIEIRAMVPVNLRPLNESPRLGNQFGLVPLVLPVGLANPLERLYDVRRRMDELKGGYQAPLAYALLSVVGQAPRLLQAGILDYLASKSTAVMTNVPGPAEPIRIAGKTVQRVMFWVPQSSDIGMGVSILSYRGGVQFGVMTDSRLCPEPQLIIDGFAPEFERLLLTLALLPRELLAGGPIDPRELEHRLFGQPPPMAS
ncbi:MAG: wax ester/triacylglycerol synthase family O-acyltransferase [Burkholderiaceae bacterium]|nr:wax ester/triacylglycerol synthase family O-acyltransferase [Burkholderiaceae bacterium]